MEKRVGMESVLVPVGLSLGILALSFLAFTKSQRQFILDRDDNTCQAPFKHNCNGSKKTPPAERKLQAHHILPQRYCESVGIENPDFEENGITLCKNAHIGGGGVHPDVAQCHSHDDFKGMFEERDRKLANHEIYWNSTWDRILHAIAIRNSQHFAKTGRIFPPRGKKT